ncbi:MAG TPA: UPF0158 family protein [Cyclobacteriaceae bacterium]|nr:UPF0158 family protein [Cyclobacteriaceae bacterium]
MTDEQITEIADAFDCGLRCYVHKENGTIVTIPDMLDEADDSEPWDNSIKEIEEHSDKYVQIERMDSNGSFRLMTDFVSTIEDYRLRHKFDQILTEHKPFRNFKIAVDNSGPYRQKWFDFKRGQLIEWVKWQLIEKGL